MAIYRTIQISFWQDGWVLSLTPEEKYFYLYLMTNSKTSQCGVYELPYKIMEMESGYNRETVEKLIQRFVDYGKVVYDKDTQEIWLKNWLKYNPVNNQNVRIRVEKELSEVKSSTILQEYNIEEDFEIELKPEVAKEEKKEPDHQWVVDYYHEKCPKLPRVKRVTNNRKKAVNARLRELGEDDLKKVFDIAGSSSFLNGNNDRRWTASFDWLVNPNNCVKVLEGKYDSLGGPGGPGGNVYSFKAAKF